MHNSTIRSRGGGNISLSAVCGHFLQTGNVPDFQAGDIRFLTILQCTSLFSLKAVQ